MYLAHWTMDQDRETMRPQETVSANRGVSSLSGVRKLFHMVWNSTRVHKGDLNFRPVLASNGALRVEKYLDSTLHVRLGDNQAARPVGRQ